jgi:orotidine-5'-phosphate decarboxylase
LCLGIDPHAYLLDRWGLRDTPEGLRTFALRAVDAASGSIGIVKPQVAFFERHGAAGYGVLEETISAARAAGLLVIADAKRGDIGSTVDAYAEAWLTPGAPLEADAMTAVAYQGPGSLAPMLDRAARGGKGVFILGATSNPESSVIQNARTSEGGTVAGLVAHAVGTLNAGQTLGSIGLVVGATVRLEASGIAIEDLAGTPILAPGFGEQGARLEDLRAIYGPLSGHVIANVGRAMLDGGAAELPARLRAAVTAVGVS